MISEPSIAITSKEGKEKYDDASKYLKKKLGGCLTIGECIAVLLEEKEQSQNWLCLTTGIDKNTLNSYKDESVKPDIRKVMAIALAFRLPPELSYILIKKIGDYPQTTEGSDFIMIMTTR